MFIAAFASATIVSVAMYVAMCNVVVYRNIELGNVYEPPCFATGHQASQQLPFEVPPVAKNIQYAEWNKFISYVRYLRFEAPVAVCYEYARQVVSDDKLTTVSAAEPANVDFMPEPGMFRDLSWFDLSAATNVVAAGDGEHSPRVWIDRDRGVFYLRETD